MMPLRLAYYRGAIRAAIALSTLVRVAAAVPASASPAVCPGDCDGDGIVRIAELVHGVNASLGRISQGCAAFDLDGDERIEISEIVAAVAAALNGCPASRPTPTPTLVPIATIPVRIESRDRIVSEDGEFELLDGSVSLRAVSLIGDDGTTPFADPMVLDLTSDNLGLLVGDVPTATYSGWSLRFSPPGEEGYSVDVLLRHIETGETVRAVSRLDLQGQNQFPAGPRVISDPSQLVVVMRLQVMFFYLYPLRDAVAGVYEVGEAQRGFFEMDLGAMFDLDDR